MHPLPFFVRIIASAILVLCVGVASCGRDEPTGIDVSEVSAPTASLESIRKVSITDFGASGNDQRDDTEALAAALDALPAEGGTIRIPAGTYLLTATPRSGIHSGIDIFRRSNVTIVGAGMEKTILRMAPGASYRGDTHLILIEQSSGITLQDLMLDGNRFQVEYGDEQSHGVDVRGSSDVHFERVIFTGMHGDGLRLIGTLTPLTWVSNVRIRDCLFTHNGRSGIAVQRAVRAVKVVGNRFTRIMDQAIDMEPSEAEPKDLAPRDFQIINNRFYDTATLALTITGISNDGPALNVVVADNEFEGAGIFVFNAHFVRIEGNTIRSGDKWAPIEIRKRSQSILIQNNLLDSRGTNGSPAIVLTYHTSAAPKEISVINNTIHTSDNPAFYARDSEALEVMGNTMSGSGNEGIKILDLNPGSPLRGFLVEHNTIRGYRVGVRVASREDVVRDVCIRDNTTIEVEKDIHLNSLIRRNCA